MGLLVLGEPEPSPSRCPFQQREQESPESSVHSLKGRGQRREPQIMSLNLSFCEWVMVTLLRAWALIWLEWGETCTLFMGSFFPAFSSPFSSSFHLKDALTTIGEKVCLEVSSCLALCGLTPFTAEKEAVLKGQIQAVANPDDPIRRIMGMTGGKMGGRDVPLEGLADWPL